MVEKEGEEAQTTVADPATGTESQLSSLIYDMSQQVQEAMGNMLNMISEIDQTSAGIVEDIANCKHSANERKKVLEEEKQRFQKAAFAVIDLLNKY